MPRLRHVPIDTYREPVAFLPRRSSVYRPADFQALGKVEVTANGRHILASLNVVDHEGMLAADEIGLSDAAFALLGLPEGTEVSVEQATPPESLDAVRAKIDGRELAAEQLEAIVRDIAELKYSKMEIAAFLVSSAAFLTTAEILALTRAMANVGNRLTWADEIVVDKHCIGGIPGNRTSMIIVPIVAAHGLTIPKTSSRAITSPAGTADTMEVLARVDLTGEEMRRVVAAESGCLVWGGHVNLSPADDVLIAVERPLNLDPSGQLVASILSKKLAAGSTRLVLEIPVGRFAKVRSAVEAAHLKKLFEFVGDQIGLTIDVVTADGGEPVGRGVGPMLEARDVMQVLERAPGAPLDLRERALMLAGRILEFDPALRGGKGAARAQELLDSGAALAKLSRIVAAQGPAPENGGLGHLVREIPAETDGTVAAIRCDRIARIARLAGAPTDKGAGIDLLKKSGDAVERGEPLYRIHAALPADFRFATQAAEKDNGYRLTPVGAG
jgi:thymidine phosphorylase